MIISGGRSCPQRIQYAMQTAWNFDHVLKKNFVDLKPRHHAFNQADVLDTQCILNDCLILFCDDFAGIFGYVVTSFMSSLSFPSNLSNAERLGQHCTLWFMCDIFHPFRFTTLFWRINYEKFVCFDCRRCSRCWATLQTQRSFCVRQNGSPPTGRPEAARSCSAVFRFKGQ